MSHNVLVVNSRVKLTGCMLHYYYYYVGNLDVIYHIRGGLNEEFNPTTTPKKKNYPRIRILNQKKTKLLFNEG